jgi:colicin import membrane protein
MKPATAGAQYRVPPEPSRVPAILLAVAVHALLLAFLWFGISWQNNEPVAVEAEVWDMKTEAAAPTPPPPQEAEPEPQPAPAPPPAPKVVEQPVEQPAPAPDIKLEREKKRKEELLKKEQQQRDLAEQKAREDATAKELAAKEKKAAEKKKAEDLAKKEAEKKLAEKKKADKEAKAKEAAENAKLAKLHDAEMRRLLEAAGSGGTGTAAKSTAPRMDSGYQAAIASKVKSNTNYTGSTDAPGNPRVEFQIEQLPTGEIISVKKTKSSGLPGFDEAVEKGIVKSSPLPRKKDGTVERSFPISFKLKDLE